MQAANTTPFSAAFFSGLLLTKHAPFSLTFFFPTFPEAVHYLIVRRLRRRIVDAIWQYRLRNSGHIYPSQYFS